MSLHVYNQHVSIHQCECMLYMHARVMCLHKCAEMCYLFYLQFITACCVHHSAPNHQLFLQFESEPDTYSLKFTHYPFPLLPQRMTLHVIIDKSHANNNILSNAFCVCNAYKIGHLIYVECRHCNYFICWLVDWSIGRSWHFDISLSLIIHFNTLINHKHIDGIVV